MKINPNVAAGSAGIQSSEIKKSDKAKISDHESKVGSAASSSKSDSVNTDISSKAKDMAQAKQIATDTPDVRDSKIAELKNRIQNKTYNVSADAIADRLVDDHLRMAGA